MSNTAAPSAATQNSAGQQPQAPDLWDVITHVMWAQPDDWQPLLAGFFALFAGVLAAAIGVLALWGVRYQAVRADDRAHKDRLWSQLLAEKIRIEEKIAALSLVVAVCIDQIEISQQQKKVAAESLKEESPLPVFRNRVNILLPAQFLDFWEKSRPAILDIKTDIGMKITFLVGKEIVDLLPQLYEANHNRDIQIHSIITDAAEDNQMLNSLISNADRVVEVANKIYQLAKEQIYVLSGKVEVIEAELKNIR
jgi:hypothetical protein